MIGLALTFTLHSSPLCLRNANLGGNCNTNMADLGRSENRSQLIPSVLPSMSRRTLNDHDPKVRQPMKHRC
jgi:hypothetical protein